MRKYLFVILISVSIGTIAQNPSLKVLDTDFSKGRLKHSDTITLNDVSKFHGHLCDGLAVGFMGLREALYQLYTDSLIDRTNNRIVSKSSPCITDIAVYLSGARFQYNTYYTDDSIAYLFIIQRIDNQKVFGVKLKPGIKPDEIDKLGLIASKGNLDACQLDYLRNKEDQFTRQILEANPKEIFIVTEIKDFYWNPVFEKTFLKTDVVNKNVDDCKKK